MIKQIKQYELLLTPFKATKAWDLNNTDNNDLILFESTGEGDGEPLAFEYLDFETKFPVTNSNCNLALEQQDEDLVIYREGLNLSGSFYPDTDPQNYDGTYKRVIYSQIKTTFYNDYRNPTKLWGLEYLDFETGQVKRQLDNTLRLFEIPRTCYGDKILPYSVVMYDASSDNDYTIIDDGFGNLYAGTNLFSNQQILGQFSNSFYSGSDGTCCVYLGVCPVTSSPQLPPLVVTNPASGITAISAILNGTVNAEGAVTFAYYQYGTTIGYGNATSVVNFGLASGSLPLAISGLTQHTTYHFRIVGYNSGGTSYGLDRIFTTLTLPPEVETLPATSITATSAVLNGFINPNEIDATAYFQYGLTTSYGTDTTPTDFGSTTGDYNALILGLSPLTTYHFRIVATNASGTSFGNDLTFTTTYGDVLSIGLGLL